MEEFIEALLNIDKQITKDIIEKINKKEKLTIVERQYIDFLLKRIEKNKKERKKENENNRNNEIFERE